MQKPLRYYVQTHLNSAWKDVAAFDDLNEASSDAGRRKEEYGWAYRVVERKVVDESVYLTVKRP